MAKKSLKALVVVFFSSVMPTWAWGGQEPLEPLLDASRPGASRYSCTWKAPQELPREPVSPQLSNQGPEGNLWVLTNNQQMGSSILISGNQEDKRMSGGWNCFCAIF